MTTLRERATGPHAAMRRTATTVWIIAMLTALGVRAWCLTEPQTTGDIFRSVITGDLVLERGFASLGQPIASQTIPDLAAWVPWTNTPYNYPAVAVLFWTSVAWLKWSVFTTRIFFTVIEAVNAVLVYRLTNRWWAAAYWCFPASIYWASHEAQFEPLEVTCILLALLAIARRWPLTAGAAIALGVQVKVMAALFVPYVAYRAWQHGGTSAVARASAGFIVALAPTIWLAWSYPIVQQVLVNFTWTPVFNPYHWAFWSHQYSAVAPSIQATLQLASYGLLAVAVIIARRSVDHLVAALPLLGLIVAAKVLSGFMWWYFLLLIPCLIPLHPLLARRRLLMLVVLLASIAIEPVAIYRLVKAGRSPIGADIHAPVADTAMRVIREFAPEPLEK